MYQGFPLTTVVRLSDTFNANVTGKIFSDVTVQFWKPGALAYQLKVVDVNTWSELSDGLYLLTMTGAELSEWGEYVIKITGVGFITSLTHLNVAMAPVGLNAKPSLCIVSGNIATLGGNPDRDMFVGFRPVNFPSRAGVSLITSSYIETRTDAMGNFSVNLVRGETVVVEIPKAGVKLQFVVPDQETALLLNLLPPMI